jgi:hypothetical protein
MTMRLTGVLALVLGVAVFASPALAGNDHGNGNANGNGNGNGAAATALVSGDSSQGKSESAPGQLKKETETVPALPEAVDAGAAVTEVVATNSEGVKPSNTTQHETHAAASSDKTKKYGNGKNAGQIAIANSAAASTILHGPGNSQPHKAAGCTGRHEVDVHALKAKGHRKGCGTSSTPGGTPSGNPGSNPSSNPTVSSEPKLEMSTPAAPGKPADPGTSQPAASVASGSTQSSHGVLGAAAVVAHGTLPFTGVQLWAVVLFALMLVAIGLALRRQAAPPAHANDR